MHMKNAVRLALLVCGVVLLVIDALAGLASLATIGGASMCAINVTTGLVVPFLIAAALTGAGGGFAFPKLWWLAALAYVPTLGFTTLDLIFAGESDRFFAGLALPVVSLLFGALASRCIRPNPSAGPDCPC